MPQRLDNFIENLFRVEIGFESGLRAACAAASSSKLPDEDARAEHPGSQSGQRDWTPTLKVRYEERGSRGEQPAQRADRDDRPHFEQHGG